MKFTRTEHALLEAIRTCKRKGFYDQVRWQFSKSVSSHTKEVTNSVKASFCRVVRCLKNLGIVKEEHTASYYLTNEEFIDFATHATSSRLVLDYRYKLLPIAFSRIATAELGDHLQKLKMTEQELIGMGANWQHMIASGIDSKEARQELTRCLNAIYASIAPQFSGFYRSNAVGWEKSDVELLLAMLISTEASFGRFYRNTEKTFVEIFDVLKNTYLDVFSDELFSEIVRYEECLSRYAEIFEGHRRRIFVNRELSSLRSHSAFVRKHGQIVSSKTKNKIEEENKRSLLQRLHLIPDDFKFMEARYSKLTASELSTFLIQIFKIPNNKAIRVLSETSSDTINSAS